MLMKCPECELQVSDKAMSCPHCGYPISNVAWSNQSKQKSRAKRGKNKRRRLPNGFGQITEIKGRNLREPFRAMVSVGKTETGRPIAKTLKPKAYFATYNLAYTALLEYHKAPYDLDKAITMSELFDLWLPEYMKTLKSDKNATHVTAGWKYCHEIHDMCVRDVRLRHIKYVVYNSYKMDGDVRVDTTANIKMRIKSMFNRLYDWAVEHEYAEDNYARKFSMSKELEQEIEANKESHKPFAHWEVQKMWEHVRDFDCTDVNDDYTDLLLIQCYTGWRPGELGLIEMKNVDIDNWNFIGGIKTDAGFNRFVPIHPEIRSLVYARYKQAQQLGSEFLFNCMDGRDGYDDPFFLSYGKYRQRVIRVIENLKLDPSHKSHDGRKTFVTNAKKSLLDEYAIKYIVGHAIDDITESVYTERQEEWLVSEMAKFKIECTNDISIPTQTIGV